MKPPSRIEKTRTAVAWCVASHRKTIEVISGAASGFTLVLVMLAVHAAVEYLQEQHRRPLELAPILIEQDELDALQQRREIRLESGVRVVLRGEEGQR